MLAIIVDKVTLDEIIVELHSLLGSEFQPSLPSSLVRTEKDLRWIIESKNYLVTRKVDGVRYCAIFGKHGLFLMDRKKAIFRVTGVPREGQVPVGTVLDGEVIQVGHSFVFLAFDLLVIGGKSIWDAPLKERLLSLALILPKDISLIQRSELSDINALQFFRKSHYDITEASVKACLKLSWYPSDGLVFTPCGRYFFGADELMFKYQTEECLRVDLIVDDTVTLDDDFGVRFRALSSDGTSYSIALDRKTLRARGKIALSASYLNPSPR